MSSLNSPQVLQEMQQFPKAEEHFDIAIKLEPQNPVHRVYKGSVPLISLIFICTSRWWISVFSIPVCLAIYWCYKEEIEFDLFSFQHADAAVTTRRGESSWACERSFGDRWEMRLRLRDTCYAWSSKVIWVGEGDLIKVRIERIARDWKGVIYGPGALFSKVPKSFHIRKALVKTQTL